jgi:hypothetical protein
LIRFDAAALIHVKVGPDATRLAGAVAAGQQETPGRETRPGVTRDQP